jgi:tRNA threonylcarbamoyladenosine biosynthesis protein TsaE
VVEHTCDLADAAATQDLGRRLAADLLSCLAAGPALLLLQGHLGAGKTCLVQGLAEGLGIAEPITSPTFALAQHYEGRLPEGKTTRLVHLDLYRLEPGAAADELFAQEEEEAAAVARGGQGAEQAWEFTGEERMRGTGVVLAVEWPERLSFLPQEAWWVRLEHRGDGRRVHWLPPAPPLATGETGDDD